MIPVMLIMKTKYTEQLIWTASRAPPYTRKPILRRFQVLQHGLVPNG